MLSVVPIMFFKYLLAVCVQLIYLGFDGPDVVYLRHIVISIKFEVSTLPIVVFGSHAICV